MLGQLVALNPFFRPQNSNELFFSDDLQQKNQEAKATISNVLTKLIEL